MTWVLSEEEGKLYLSWAWNRQRLEAIVERMYRLSAKVAQARKKIKDNTELRLIPTRELDHRDTLFSEHCNCFTGAEKDRLLEYAKIANHKLPKGYGECGYLLVFQHRCPNNTVPILHESHSKWEGLFLRHD